MGRLTRDVQAAFAYRLWVDAVEKVPNGFAAKAHGQCDFGLARKRPAYFYTQDRPRIFGVMSIPIQLCNQFFLMGDALLALCYVLLGYP